MLCGDVTNLFLVAFICFAPFRSFCGEYGEHIKVDTLNFMNHLCEIKRLKMILFRFFIFFVFIICHQNVTSVLCPSNRSEMYLCTDGNEFVYCARRSKREETIIGPLEIFALFYVSFFLFTFFTATRCHQCAFRMTSQWRQSSQSTIRPKGSK